MLRLRLLELLDQRMESGDLAELVPQTVIQYFSQPCLWIPDVRQIVSVFPREPKGFLYQFLCNVV